MQTRLNIGGKFVDGTAGGTIEIASTADGTVLATGAEATAEDIDHAGPVARRAFPAETDVETPPGTPEPTKP